MLSNNASDVPDDMSTDTPSTSFGSYGSIALFLFLTPYPKLKKIIDRQRISHIRSTPNPPTKKDTSNIVPSPEPTTNREVEPNLAFRNGESPSPTVSPEKKSNPGTATYPDFFSTPAETSPQNLNGDGGNAFPFPPPSSHTEPEPETFLDFLGDSPNHIFPGAPLAVAFTDEDGPLAAAFTDETDPAFDIETPTPTPTSFQLDQSEQSVGENNFNTQKLADDKILSSPPFPDFFQPAVPDETVTPTSLNTVPGEETVFPQSPSAGFSPPVPHHLRLPQNNGQQRNIPAPAVLPVESTPAPVEPEPPVDVPAALPSITTSTVDANDDQWDGTSSETFLPQVSPSTPAPVLAPAPPFSLAPETVAAPKVDPEVSPPATPSIVGRPVTVSAPIPPPAPESVPAQVKVSASEPATHAGGTFEHDRPAPLPDSGSEPGSTAVSTVTTNADTAISSSPVVHKPGSVPTPEPVDAPAVSLVTEPVVALAPELEDVNKLNVERSKAALAASLPAPSIHDRKINRTPTLPQPEKKEKPKTKFDYEPPAPVQAVPPEGPLHFGEDRKNEEVTHEEEIKIDLDDFDPSTYLSFGWEANLGVKEIEERSLQEEQDELFGETDEARQRREASLNREAIRKKYEKLRRTASDPQRLKSRELIRELNESDW